MAATDIVLRDSVGARDIALSDSLATVNSDLAISYAVLERVSSDLSASYGVAAKVSADLAASFAVHERVSTDLAATFAVLETASSDLVATYDLLGRVAGDLACSYGVEGKVSSDLAAAYAVLQTVSSDLAASYGVAERVSADLAASFGIEARLASDLEATYAVLVRVSADLAASYDIDVDSVIGQPVADIDQGAWLPSSGTDLYPMIDELVADDDDYIYTDAASSCEILLSEMTDPLASTGHVLRLRMDSPYGQTIRVSLKVGTTEIAAWTQLLTASTTDYDFQLSESEADDISDYSDVRFVLEAQ